MYTVLWTENGKDRWEHCDDRNEVAALLIREGIRDDEDVLIFSPDAEDYTLTSEDIFKDI